MARPLEEIDQSTFAGQVGARIRARRLKAKLAAADAAEAAGVPYKTWNNWETGRHLPLEALPAIALALRCKPRALLPE